MWHLVTPKSESDRQERRVKQTADHPGGDMAVCH